MRKTLSLIVIAMILFSYGIAVGRYELPPFSLIQSLKKAVFESTSGQAETKPKTIRIDNWRFPKYIQKVSIFESLPGRATYVMAGDSITTRCQWNEMFANAGVINRGIGGDTSFGLRHRIDEIISRQPRKVFIMIGINDLHHQWPIERIVENVTDICMRLSEAGIRPVLLSVLFVGQNSRYADNADVATVNEMLQTWCAAHQVTFIDLNPILAPEGYLLNLFTSDGVHLNAAGYSAWADVIRKHVTDQPM